MSLTAVLGGCSKPAQVEQKDKADQAVNTKSPKGSLEDSIVGKVITLEMKEKEMQVQMTFNANGVMLVGADGNMQDLGLTYKVDDHKVLVFEDGERDGGMLFSSTSPKVGDQVEMGPEDNKRNVTIIKIEQADQNLLKAKIRPKLEGVNYKKLEEREGIYYLKDSDTPYTGKAYEGDGRQQEKEWNYKDGKMDGLFTEWHGNGQKEAEAIFKDGKLVEGSEKRWNRKGELR